MALPRALPVPLRIAAALLSVVALVGCMTVHIDAGDADLRVVRHVGVLHVELQSPQRAVVGTLSGIGLAGTPLGWSAGYTRQRWAAIGPQCRAVVWLDGPLDHETRRDLERVARVCLLDDPATHAAARGPEELAR